MTFVTHLSLFSSFQSNEQYVHWAHFAFLEFCVARARRINIYEKFLIWCLKHEKVVLFNFI